MVPPLRILHTSDLHGALTREKAARLAAARTEADIWLDSGDAVGRPRGMLAEDPTLALLADSGCDAMVPGNHEFLLLGTETPLPFVCANLLRGESRLFPALREFMLSGRRVAVVGITTPYLKYSDRPLRRLAAAGEEFRRDVRTIHPFDAAAEWVPKAKEEADTVIVLSHLGAQGDAKLARAAPEADIILGGHSHELLPPAQRSGVWSAQPGVGASHYGRYEWDGARLTGELVRL